MHVLNGAEGVTQMLTSVIGQGLAGLDTVRSMLASSTPRTTVTPERPAVSANGSPAAKA